MRTNDKFDSAAAACDEALNVLESGGELAARALAELDQTLRLLSSLALSEVNQSWREAANSLITRRLSLEAGEAPAMQLT
jgi:hypothetical protein